MTNASLDSMVDHTLAARQLAVANKEPFLTNLFDMILLELGKRLASQEERHPAATIIALGSVRGREPHAGEAFSLPKRRPGPR